jgi:HK97 gp10 family phage protein
MGVNVDNGTVRLQGFDELAAKLRAIPEALRKRVLLNALRTGGRLVRDEARREAPVLARATPYRTPGLLRKSISVRTSKVARKAGNVGVFINVRPAKGAKFKTTNRKVFGLRVKGRRQVRASQRGAQSKLDPFYWRFLNFGTRYINRIDFLTKGARKFPQVVAIFKTEVGRWIAKTNSTGKVRP